MMPPTMLPSLRRMSRSSRKAAFELEEHAVPHREQRIARFHEEDAAATGPAGWARHRDLSDGIPRQPDIGRTDAILRRELVCRHRTRRVGGRGARLTAEYRAM